MINPVVLKVTITGSTHILSDVDYHCYNKNHKAFDALANGKDVAVLKSRRMVRVFPSEVSTLLSSDKLFIVGDVN